MRCSIPGSSAAQPRRACVALATPCRPRHASGHPACSSRQQTVMHGCRLWRPQAGVVAFKLYPAGATTNSDSGVTDFRKCLPTLRAMAEVGRPRGDALPLPLCGRASSPLWFRAAQARAPEGSGLHRLGHQRAQGCTGFAWGRMACSACVHVCRQPRRRAAGCMQHWRIAAAAAAAPFVSRPLPPASCAYFH